MDYVYQLPPDCDSVALSALTNATHRKQLIYAGRFVKDVPGQPRVEFEVTEDVLDRWAREGNEMLSEGVKIPMPSEHNDKPENKRADVVGFERGYDSKGREALFAHFSFTDKEHEKNLSSADVSIYVPEEYTNAATGKKYSRPIRHVAFTNQPVIPGLDPSEVLQLSYEMPKTMKLVDLAKKLGIELKDDASEDDAAKAIIAHDKKLRDTVEAAQKAAKEKPAPKPEPEKKPALAAGFVNMAVKTRNQEIDSLLEGGNITPATAKELKEQFASTETVTLALSEDGSFNDGFDGVFRALQQNQAIKLSSTTGPQKLRDEENPLLKNAEARAKAAGY